MNAFQRAAALLDGDPAAGPDGTDAHELLERLGLSRRSGGGASPAPSNHGALLRVAGRMARIFELSAPDAPGLAFVGGSADPASYGLPAPDGGPLNVSGCGRAVSEAFAACVGEAVEALSRLEWGDERLERHPAGRAPAGMRPETHAGLLDQLGAAAADADIDWLPARTLAAQEPTRVPADLCLRRGRKASDGAVLRLGGGCAAGESAEDAALAALLELVERDAAALWWIGGRRPRALSLELFDAGGIAPLLEELRQDQLKRRTWLLDITTDLAVPCAAAVSLDKDGRGFACGLAARTSLAAAARAAILELCQMELANSLVRLKLEAGGEAALAPADRRHRRRMDGVDADRCALLFAAKPPSPSEPEPAPSAAGRLDWLTGRLASHGIDCLLGDLTRPALAIPCVQALAPQLQSLPLKHRTARLERAVSETGGGAPCTDGIELL